ncbi:MAG: glutamate--cysteine ligase [Tepidamorphaceae bacterium]|nr:glutamate--cysteine ligase [Rhodobiaceae bacterium]MCC0048983.1 glutamate--cysteine ligase [Rhodobiaceae bacterium]
MARDRDDLTPITSRAELIEELSAGCKPKADFRIGTEHEKFGFRLMDKSPVEYEGDYGIRALLENMQAVLRWEPILDEGRIIGLTDPIGGGAISLEPGGQFELSGAPLESIHQTCREVHSHLAQVREAADRLGIGFLGLGVSPKWTRAETPMMPKSRYRIMTNYMPKVGSKGLDMMYRTCTVQVNLDFSSEADMVRKMRVGIALQPIATALFANSPFLEGKPNGFLSYRSEIWRDVDNDRSGMLPFVFDEGFGFERYVDYALDVPMYFVKRGSTYHDVAGQSFRDLLDGRLPGLPGEKAMRSDWVNHLSTIFPEVRLKRFLEMRGADGSPWRGICALPALFVGLMYDETALDAASDLISDWTECERQRMRDNVPRTALKTKFRKTTVQEIAREVVQIATDGLKRRAFAHGGEADETRFIEPLAEIAETGVTNAERLLERYHNEWKGDIDRVFVEEAY